MTEAQTTPADKPKVGFLKDASGKPSTMRLMSFISLAAAVFFGWLTISTGDTSPNGVYITTMFLLGAFAPKAVQKFIESKDLKR